MNNDVDTAGKTQPWTSCAFLATHAPKIWLGTAVDAMGVCVDSREMKALHAIWD